MRMRQATRVLGAPFDEALRPLGLQISQLPLLCAAALHGEAGASMRDLARATGLDPTTVTRNVRPLENAGLLRVARSPSDARTRVVLLTHAGERMLEAVYPVWQRVLTKVRRAFGATTFDEISHPLTNIIDQRQAALADDA